MHEAEGVVQAMREILSGITPARGEDVNGGTADHVVDMLRVWDYWMNSVEEEMQRFAGKAAVMSGWVHLQLNDWESEE